MSLSVFLSVIRLQLLVLLVLPSLVFSAEYYVDGINGNDANDGSEVSPWRTIGHALDFPGRWINQETNTLYVLAATYNESINLTLIPLRSLNITGVGRDGEMPLIDATGASGDHAIHAYDYGGIIQGLALTGAAENGINLVGNSLTAKVIDCTIYGNKKGIHVSDNSTPLISGNTLFLNSESGIASMAGSAAIINGNRIYQNGNGDPSGPSAGICVAGSAAPVIHNNIIRKNFPSGICIVDSSSPIISNNIITEHQADDKASTAIKIVHNIGIDEIVISNNIFYDNDYALFSQIGRDVSGNDFNSYWENGEDFFGFSAGSSDIFSDPLLDGNYGVLAGSPCIDSGTSKDALVTDFDGNPRPRGAGFDRGIYEYPPRNSTSVCLSPILLLLLAK